MITTLIRFVFFASLLAISIFLSNRLYGVATDQGRAYYTSFFNEEAKLFDSFERKGVYYVQRVNKQKKSCQIGLASVADEKRTALVDIGTGVVADGVVMESYVSPFVVDDPQEFKIRENRTIVGFTDNSNFFRHSKSLVFELPPGLLVQPWMNS